MAQKRAISFQQISPYSHLVSGGKATVAKMFVNMASGQQGLVCQYDVVCFDEISGISFDQKDGVKIMKGYMANGEFSRGKESIRAEGGVVMVGNFDVDVEQQQWIGHLLGPLPKEMRGDTAFHDRLHAYAPGWDFPKLDPNKHLTNHFGMVSDFLSECWRETIHSNRHGRSYDYDRHVPIIFMGGEIKPGWYPQACRPEDIAPTIAAILGVDYPREEDSRVIAEILR